MNISKIIQDNINFIMIVCILILIVYLVTSNEGFQMNVLENTQEIDSNFDFVAIYNLIKANYNSLNELTTQERDTYNEIVTNIEAKQNDGYVFDIDYIANNLRNASTTTTTTTTQPSSESFNSISKVPIPDSTEVTVIEVEKFTDSSTKAPKGYILLDTNQVQFLRYFVFLSVIRGVFDQLVKVNNYYFDPTGVDNSKFINMEFDNSDSGKNKTVNGREVIVSFTLNSNIKNYPSIEKGDASTSLPNVDVIGNMGLLNIYVDVIGRYINLGLGNDSVMKKVLSVDIGTGISLRNEITRVINDLIQQFHTYGLYYMSDDNEAASYTFTLTI